MGQAQIRVVQPEASSFPFAYCADIIPDNTDYTAADLRDAAAYIYTRFRPNPRADDSLAEANVQMHYLLSRNHQPN